MCPDLFTYFPCGWFIETQVSWVWVTFSVWSSPYLHKESEEKIREVGESGKHALFGNFWEKKFLRGNRARDKGERVWRKHFIGNLR